MKIIKNIRGYLSCFCWQYFPKVAFAYSHNVDKYQSQAFYKRFLRDIKDSLNVDFVAMSRLQELHETSKIVVAIRHDVDYDIHAALALARIEHALGITASYYFLHTAPYYGFRDSSGKITRYLQTIRRFKKIQSLGHEIGLHIDTLNDYLSYGIPPETTLKNELEFLRRSGINVVGVASHGSLHNYGASNYEIFEGMSIDGRTDFEDRNGVLHRNVLGNISLKKYNLLYEANFIIRSSIVNAEEYERLWKGKFKCPWKYTDKMHCNYDYRIGIWGRDFWTVYNFKEDTFSICTTEEIFEILTKISSGKRVVLDIHPVYVSRAKDVLILNSLFKCVKSMYRMITK